jgi:hypothetical protein
MRQVTHALALLTASLESTTPKRREEEEDEDGEVNRNRVKKKDNESGGGDIGRSRVVKELKEVDEDKEEGDDGDFKVVDMDSSTNKVVSVTPRAKGSSLTASLMSSKSQKK